MRIIVQGYYRPRTRVMRQDQARGKNHMAQMSSLGGGCPVTITGLGREVLKRVGWIGSSMEAQRWCVACKVLASRLTLFDLAREAPVELRRAPVGRNESIRNDVAESGNGRRDEEAEVQMKFAVAASPVVASCQISGKTRSIRGKCSPFALSSFVPHLPSSILSTTTGRIIKPRSEH